MTIPLKRGLLLLAAAALTAAAGAADRSVRRLLTVADAIETHRAMVDEEMNATFVSPDGRRFSWMLIRGDLARDGLWVELMSGNLASMESAAPRRVGQLFTRGLGARDTFGQIAGSPILTQPWANVPTWLDNEDIAMLWEDAAGTLQAIAIDADTGKIRFLTSSDTDVTRFAAASGGMLLYDARARFFPQRSRQLLQEGFVVKSRDAAPLLAGIVDGTSSNDFGSCDRYVSKRGARPHSVAAASRVPCEFSLVFSRPLRTFGLFSPDGRFALVNGPVEEVPVSWRRYRQPEFASLLREKLVNPEGLQARAVSRLFLLDLNQAAARPLWDAPLNPVAKTTAKWSSDGRFVVLGQTFTPAETADAAGLSGNAIAEVDAANGTFRLLETSLESTLSRNASHESIRIELRQDLNTPPIFYAVDDKTGRARALHDLNPRLTSAFKLGQVEFIDWQDGKGDRWRGRLYYPANYRAGRTYPLVIQTHGYAEEDEFSIYGSGNGAVSLGPGWSVYLAQPLAALDIVVLQIGGPVAADQETDGLTRMTIAQAGIEAAIRHLSNRGLIAQEKIGVMGHSATGRLVEYLVSHSARPFGAAIAADHADGNYLQAALYGWPDHGASQNGAAAFGTGLSSWLRNSPAFNVEKIHTPLQLQVTSAALGNASLLWGWEMFSRLRYLGKPVEYYVAPDIERGSHILQNPRQLFTLQERALDWWRFWLQGAESTDPRKAQQYAGWRELRKRHDNGVRAGRRFLSPVK